MKVIKFLFACSIFVACITFTIPSIVPFNYSTDKSAVEAILKKEWTSLFWTSKYDQNLVDLIFKHLKPGDTTARDRTLLISILKEEMKIVGFITYYQVDKNSGHVELLAIESSFKGKGYGKQLLNYVQEFFAQIGCKYLQLYVYTSNKTAMQFYKHLGFIVKKTFPGYLLFSKQIG